MSKQGLLDRPLLLLLLLLLAAASCRLLLLKCVAHPLTLKGGVKPRRGKPTSVIKTRTRTQLCPSVA